MFYLTETVDIKKAIDRLSLCETLWVDTETASWNTPAPELSLIQVLADSRDRTGKSSYILDVLGRPDLSEYFIRKIMAQTSIEKVFHNSSYDLKFLGRERAKNITCTLSTARKITRERLGVTDLKLKTLAGELCKFPAFEIDRESQGSDWSKRPLETEQLHYAAMDVVYLAHLHRYLALYTSKILKALIEFFREKQWSFSKHPRSHALLMKAEGKNGVWDCIALSREEKEYFIFYSLCPVTTPPDKYETMAEFLMSINSKVLIGNFEINLDDGSIRYKTSIKVRGDRLTQALIAQLVSKNIHTMDVYLPQIKALCQGELSTSR